MEPPSQIGYLGLIPGDFEIRKKLLNFMVDESRADLEERFSRKNESSAIQLEAHERLTLLKASHRLEKGFQNAICYL